MSKNSLFLETLNQVGFCIPIQDGDRDEIKKVFLKKLDSLTIKELVIELMKYNINSYPYNLVQLTLRDKNINDILNE